jgi:squalene synthase HpnC
MDTIVRPDADLRSGKDKSGENFPVGSVLIAARLRPHVHAYYDFVRAADDVSDSPDLSPAEKIARLDAMEHALRGDPEARSTSAGPLRASLAQTGLPPELATDLLIAFRRDAITLRTPDWAALMDYCRYSANPVGRYLLALHGEGPSTEGPSDALCASLQILNHLQDCGDDLRSLDRCYIPDDLLAREGLTPEALLHSSASPALRRVFARVLDGVDVLNREAARLPGLIVDRRMRLEAAIIVGLAHRLARRLRREDPLAVRVKLRPVDVAASIGAALRHLPAGRAR